MVGLVERQFGLDVLGSVSVDEVAADVGIAKASLYKHFASKEALAAAAMVRVLERGAQLLAEQAVRSELAPVDRLRAVARWALEQLLRGQMPTLPSPPTAVVSRSQ